MDKQKIFNKKTLCWFIFILYSILNLFLVLKHEPWRDEIHAWLMSKELSFSELVVASRFDGHPILWHLILMPFAKSNFPIITLNIISYIIMLISAWLLLFKTKLSLFFKVIILFTIPFTYIYSAISRNYCLIVLLLVLIALLYDKRYEKPILYSVLIALLVHTHSLVWGIVAGLTITFHFDEIILFFKHKNKANIKKVLIGLTLIVVSTILVVLELYGTTNTDYGVNINSYILRFVGLLAMILLTFFVFTLFNKSYFREYMILFFGFAFQILVYTCFYSSVLFQRFMLIFVLILFYLLLLSKANLEERKFNILCIIYLLFMCVFALNSFANTVTNDIKYPYSSAQEMAKYINENLPANTTILIDASIIGQSIIPYLDTANFYDIAYNSYVTCANVSHDKERILNSLRNLDKTYSGKYIIICNHFVPLDPSYSELIFETKNSMINEIFSLYYIY